MPGCCFIASWGVCMRKLFINSSSRSSAAIQKLLYRDRHSGLDPESRRRSGESREPFCTLDPDFHREPWIPAGVYPVLDTGRE